MLLVEDELGRTVNDRTIEDNAQETVSFSFILFNQPLVGKELIMTAWQAISISVISNKN